MNDTFYMLDESPREGIQDVLATNLRRLRIARHLSLSELARATGMSKATLSSIENGRANPTVETLAALAAALRVALTELLEELPLAEITIVRAAAPDRQPGEDIREHAIDDFTPAALHLAELRVPANHSREAPAQPSGSRAHVFVLEGKLIAGPVERSTELGRGDYASFPTDIPHVYQTGRHGARALLLSERPR